VKLGKTNRSATLVVAASDSMFPTGADYICDGTNDHVEIQAAIDALPATGGEVKLLDGTYNIEVSLVQDSYQTLRGCGRNTILTTTTADLDIITATGGAGTEKVGILIADLCVDGTAGGVVNDMGINWNYVNYSIIENVWCLNNGENGIFCGVCNFNKVKDNTLAGSGASGLYLSQSDNNIVKGNICQKNSSQGIRASDSHNNIITDNNCQENIWGGLYLSQSDNNIVKGNICSKNSTQGIYLDSSNNNSVRGNTCSINSQSGDDTTEHILLATSDYNLIEGNLCRSPTIGTTLTVGEPIAETEIAVTNTAGFEVGMGVVIDLGGGNEEYHYITAITAGAPGVIVIDAGLTNAQGAGETIDVPEARYGINISNAACDKNVVQGNDLYDAGKTANFNDVGTCTIVTDDNRDITPVQVKRLVLAQNTSGGALTIGNVVSYESAAGAVGFETPTAIGDPKVWGMLAENIADNAYGYIQVLGGTVLLDATNVGGGAIVIGDLLCAEVGSRARKAAAGHTAFALALENCDIADGVIDALIIKPRMI